MNTCGTRFLWIGVACLLLTCSQHARGQSTASNPSSQAQPPASATSAPTATRPAKVWTNEDMVSLRQESAVSTVGTTPPKPRTSAKAPHRSPNDSRTKSYQAEVARLRAELPPIEHQIADLEAALSGSTISSVRTYYGVKPDDWMAQLENLKKRRDEVQARINAIEDDARHQGVPPNALP